MTFAYVNLSQEDIVFEFNKRPSNLQQDCFCYIQSLSTSSLQMSLRAVVLQNAFNTNSNTRLQSPFANYSISETHPSNSPHAMEYFSDTGFYNNLPPKRFNTDDVMRLGVKFLQNSPWTVQYEAYVFAALAPGQPNGKCFSTYS